MKTHDLTPQRGSRKNTRRVGRGTAAGQGKTAGKGTKGQLARSGPGLPAWFEGGQMPLHMRLPKLRGFKNRFKKVYAVVNLSKLSRFQDGAKVDAEALLHAGLIKPGAQIKILGAGRLKRKLTVETHAISNSAREAIEKAGGTVTVLNAPRAEEEKPQSESTPTE